MRMSLPIPPWTGCADTFTFSTWFRPSARAAPGSKTAIEHARAPENQVFLPDVIAPCPSFGERNVLLALRTNSWRRNPEEKTAKAAKALGLGRADRQVA